MTNQKLKTLLVGFILTLALIIPTGCFAKQPTAIVIDEETGKPIEGAVAIAIWRRGEISLNGIFEGGFEVVSKIIEVKSDKDGKIYIPGYWNWHIFKDSYPDLNVYKFGYVCWDRRSIFDKGKRTDFDKDHRLVRLPKWPERFSFVQHLSFIYSCTNGDHNKANEKLFSEEYKYEQPYFSKEMSNRDK
jgi:hypothetical protein